MPKTTVAHDRIWYQACESVGTHSSEEYYLTAAVIVHTTRRLGVRRVGGVSVELCSGGFHPCQRNNFNVSSRLIPSICKPDIFDDDGVEIEISTAPPTLLPTSAMRDQKLNTRRSVLCVGQQNAHPEAS